MLPMAVSIMKALNPSDQVLSNCRHREAHPARFPSPAKAWPATSTPGSHEPSTSRSKKNSRKKP